MPRIIFTSRYLKGISKARIKNLVEYMGTRPGVATDKTIDRTRPATKNQEKYIQEIVKLSPGIKGSFEYQDYMANPTIAGASELIDKFVEDNLSESDDLERYIDYIAKRPRVERTAGTHGLWGADDEHVSISKVVEEASANNQYIYTHVISLRREDASRLGYESAAAWRSLVKSKIPVISQAMNIPLDDLKLYGAYHDQEHHPHIHLMVYSTGPRKGYLKNAGIEKMRSAFATEIFKQDLVQVYEQKDDVRLELNKSAGERIHALVERIKAKDYDNPAVNAMITRLADEIKHVKGRKVYGNLNGADKRAARNLVDAIVSEISKDPDIAEIYDHWCELQDDIKRLYMNSTPAHPALVDEKEFITIKNMILRCVEDLNIESSDHHLADPWHDGNYSEFFNDQTFGSDDVSLFIESSAAPIPAGASFYAKWTEDYKQARYYLYGKGVIQNNEMAFTLFYKEAEKGYVQSDIMWS